jgi:thymidine kinase
MNRLHHFSGKLELIIGCMFSGKSTCLLNLERQHKLLGHKILVVNHSSDTRYGENIISSHDMISSSALSISSLIQLKTLDNYKQIDIFMIEEAQFFDDLYEFVLDAVEKDRKHIIVSGLDGDYKRQPYEQILRLIPIADVVERRNALCIKCRDGTLASFSKRVIDRNERQLVGSQKEYIPVCRFHYHNV